MLIKRVNKNIRESIKVQILLHVYARLIISIKLEVKEQEYNPAIIILEKPNINSLLSKNISKRVDIINSGQSKKDTE